MAAAGCGGGPGEDGRPTVVAAFYPLAFAAREIEGGRAQVVDLTPAGAEPHDLELSAGDARTLQAADVVLYFGGGFQPALDRALGDADGDKVDLLATDGLRVRDDDPHVWLDPARFETIVLRIGDALDRRVPAERLATRLRQLDRDLARGLRRCERRELVTSHEAFAYLAERYGLEQVAVTGLSPEAEPSPQELRRVVERVREAKATTVFTETLVSPRIAQTVARETGAATEVLDPIEGLTADELAAGDDYFSLMRRNLARLREALGCR